MTASRILAIIATVLFCIAFVLTLGDTSNAKLISELTLGGLASFAAAHWIV